MRDAIVVLCVVAVGGLRPLQGPTPTRVVDFVPSTSTDRATSGTCGPSLSAAYRRDAFSCTIGDSIHDPCFQTTTGNVLCDVDPRKPSSGVLVLKSVLAQPAAARQGPPNRAWLFELTDGTLCRPLLDNRRQVDGMIEIYSCKWMFPGEADAVLGELDSSSPVWTIQQVTLNKKVEPPTIKSLLTAPVKTVWR